MKSKKQRDYSCEISSIILSIGILFIVYLLTGLFNNTPKIFIAIIFGFIYTLIRYGLLEDFKKLNIIGSIGVTINTILYIILLYVVLKVLFFTLLYLGIIPNGYFIIILIGLLFSITYIILRKDSEIIASILFYTSILIGITIMIGGGFNIKHIKHSITEVNNLYMEDSKDKYLGYLDYINFKRFLQINTINNIKSFYGEEKAIYELGYNYFTKKRELKQLGYSSTQIETELNKFLKQEGVGDILQYSDKEWELLKNKSLYYLFERYIGLEEQYVKLNDLIQVNKQLINSEVNYNGDNLFKTGRGNHILFHFEYLDGEIQELYKGFSMKQINDFHKNAIIYAGGKIIHESIIKNNGKNIYTFLYELNEEYNYYLTIDQDNKSIDITIISKDINTLKKDFNFIKESIRVNTIE